MRNIALFILSLLTLQLWAQTDIEVINIENPAVQAFLADSTYWHDTDYRNSVILNYSDRDKFGGRRLDRPVGKELCWTPTTSASNIDQVLITVSEHPDFSDSWTHTTTEKTDTTFLLTNFFPHRTYHYKAEEIHTDGTRVLVAEGALRTEGRLRMIEVRNGCPNVRDLGGWPTQYGVPIKYGVLYRSGSLDRLSAEGRHDYAQNLNVRAELDLREESRLTKSRLGDDCDYMLIRHGVKDAGTNGVKNSQHLYAKDLQWVIDRVKEGKAVDWHCAIGCDRCGTMSFLVEGLLGMSEQDICRDYELSTLSLGKLKNGQQNKRTRSGLKGMFAHIRQFGPADNLALCFYNYWLEAGISDADLDYLLSVMLPIE